MSKILTTGSREWTSEKIVRLWLSKFSTGTIIVHGACPWGADSIVDRVSVSLGFEVRRYPARWGTYRKGYDGHARNQRMVDQEHFPEEPIDLCLAFPKNLIQHGGTIDCMDRARKSGIRVCPICKTCGRILAEECFGKDDQGCQEF